MKQMISLIIGAGLIAGSVYIVGHAAINVWSIAKDKELANEARYQCALSSRYETTDQSGAKVSYPVPQLYTVCMSEKGMDK